MCLLFSDQMKKTVQNFNLIAMNNHSNLSGTSLEHDLSPLQLEINLFSQFSAQASVKALRHIGHLSWRHPLPHLSPRFKSLPATRLGKRKAARDTAATAAVTAATSDRRGTLAAVGLSLLWAAFSPGTIAMVARGIKHSWSPTRVCALNETSSTGRQRNMVLES
jgi:hypothetical protein